MKKYFIILIILIAGAISIKLFIFSSDVASNDISYKDGFIKNYKVFVVEIPDNLRFAGENVPIDNFDVRESYDREILVNTYWQSQTLLLIKKANRWFPVIEPILKEQGVPDDFKYLALIESGFSNVVSPAGATGFWQFIKETGKKYGLEINDEVDERYNVEKSTIAACKYLKASYDTLKNWTLAAASYNMGLDGLLDQIDIQKENTYYNLLLSDETSRYIFRILAIKSIINNPKAYGFYLRKTDLYPPIPTYNISLDSTVSNFADFASKLNINYKILKQFNPWLRKPKLTNKSSKLYTLKIPKEGYLKYSKLLEGVDNYKIISSESN